jgi:hypothetical protein
MEERKWDIEKTSMICDLKKRKNIWLEDTLGSWSRQKIDEQAIERVEELRRSTLATVYRLIWRR